MAIVNIVIPRVAAKVFTGGLLTIFEYANGLAARGHTVNVIPIMPSEYPQWFTPRFQLILPKYSLSGVVRRALSGIGRLDKLEIKKAIQTLLTAWSRWGTYGFQRAGHIEVLRDILPPADVTLATSYETALPVFLCGTGRLYYFMQHYEPYFANEKVDPHYAKVDAEFSYHLGISKIANSSWLAGKFRDIGDGHVNVCLNAIDQSVYFPDGHAPGDSFVVLSYGGRRAEWKGFREAAQAIAIARRQVPELVWKVYGEALLPPDNDIASYTDLGFVTGADLRRQYSTAHVVLCPAWYESFPLYPLEAMACGAAVITTPYGTEDYAINEQNALVIPPRNPDEMANAIINLYRNRDLREQLIRQGVEDARRFTWQRSVETMASILQLD